MPPQTEPNLHHRLLTADRASAERSRLWLLPLHIPGVENPDFTESELDDMADKWARRVNVITVHDRTRPQGPFPSRHAAQQWAVDHQFIKIEHTDMVRFGGGARWRLVGRQDGTYEWCVHEEDRDDPGLDGALVAMFAS